MVLERRMGANFSQAAMCVMRNNGGNAPTRGGGSSRSLIVSVDSVEGCGWVIRDLCRTKLSGERLPMKHLFQNLIEFHPHFLRELRSLGHRHISETALLRRRPFAPSPQCISDHLLSNLFYSSQQEGEYVRIGVIFVFVQSAFLFHRSIEFQYFLFVQTFQNPQIRFHRFF